jgi:hypothetical protein
MIWSQGEGQMERFERTETTELSFDQLETVTGGAGVLGSTGSIVFANGTAGSSVSWPGTVGGVKGIRTASSNTGLSWHQSQHA